MCGFLAKYDSWSHFLNQDQNQLYLVWFLQTLLVLSWTLRSAFRTADIQLSEDDDAAEGE